MIPFEYLRPESVSEASQQLESDETMLLAGGTTMLDLMKLNVLKPSRLSSIKPVLDDSVRKEDDRLVVEPGCTMSQLADHPLVKDELPAVRQSLILAASPQIRNMATIGGNLLQRTRSTYFRHVEMPWPQTDDSAAGQESQARFGEGVDTSAMAVLGNRGQLVAMYPGDFAVTFVAFRGRVHLEGTGGSRIVESRDFYQIPTDDYQYSTVMKPGELITAIDLPLAPALTNSLYLKIRERSSYAFALASASIGLQLDGSGSAAKVAAANVGIGGLGSIPWHSEAAEAELIGQTASDATFAKAADAALRDAKPPAGVEFKVPLAKRCIVRALKILRDQGPLSDSELWAFQHGRGIA